MHRHIASALKAVTVSLGCLTALPVLAQSNSGSILQQGTDNAATITQTGAASSDVSIDQIGENHNATVTDTGSEALVDIDQSGSTQSATVRLTGERSGGELDQEGFGNLADIEVGGAINSFTILQTTQSPGTLTGNSIGLVQSGISNRAIQTQRGSENTMSLQQDGANNVADMLQDGSLNTMTLMQAGNDNGITWTQTGTGLPDLGITQTGGAQATITQTNAPLGNGS